MGFDQGFTDGLRFVGELIRIIPNLDVVGYIIGYFFSVFFMAVLIVALIMTLTIIIYVLCLSLKPSKVREG